MKLRDKFLYMSFGAGLVVLGMVLNSFLIDDADAQVDAKDVRFRNILCDGIVVKNSGFVLVDDDGKARGLFGLDDSGEAQLIILDDDGKTEVAYLGANPNENGEVQM